MIDVFREKSVPVFRWINPAEIDGSTIKSAIQAVEDASFFVYARCPDHVVPRGLFMVPEPVKVTAGFLARSYQKRAKEAVKDLGTTDIKKIAAEICKPFDTYPGQRLKLVLALLRQRTAPPWEVSLVQNEAGILDEIETTSKIPVNVPAMQPLVYV